MEKQGTWGRGQQDESTQAGLVGKLGGERWEEALAQQPLWLWL